MESAWVQSVPYDIILRSKNLKMRTVLFNVVT